MKKASTYSLFSGTSGWAYATWKPGFYPKAVSAKKFLEYYGTQLNSVEVNFTFRSLPTPAQIENWLTAVGDHFRFSFKAPQTITHIKRLKDCGEALSAFFTAIEPARVAGKMGCVLFQLPPNFKADPARLQAFLELKEFRHAPRCAFEFRHESWFTEEIYTLLRTHNIAVCIAESETLATPETFLADYSVYRLRMSGGYNAQQVAAFSKKFAALRDQRDAYIYFKHEDEPTGALAAVELLQQVNA